MNEPQYHVARLNLESRRKRISQDQYDEELQHLMDTHSRWRNSGPMIAMMDHPHGGRRLPGESMWNLSPALVKQISQMHSHAIPYVKDEEEMKPLPDTATADSVNAAKAEADTKRKRDHLIRELASIVEAADTQRNTARDALKKAKEGRRALKDVRDNPKATDAEIRDAIKEAQKCGIYGRS